LSHPKHSPTQTSISSHPSSSSSSSSSHSDQLHHYLCRSPLCRLYQIIPKVHLRPCLFTRRRSTASLDFRRSPHQSFSRRL
jgi:hypothetical protein